MKKKIVIFLIVAAVIAGGAFGAYKSGIFGGGSSSGGDTSSEIYVMSLSEIMGDNSSYSSDVFMGIVEGQETTSVTKSSERELDQIFVSEGDTVTVGTPLFSYKSDTLEAENVQLNFDIESQNISIRDYNRTIEKKTEE